MLDPFDWGDEPRPPEEHTEPEFLGTVTGAPWAPFGGWGDLIDPESIHDYVHEEEDEE